jgi:hypothetical protein
MRNTVMPSFRNAGGNPRRAGLVNRFLPACCCALVLAVTGCGENRPPTFGELTGQPAPEEKKDEVAPVRSAAPDDESVADAAAEVETPKTFAELRAGLKPGVESTDDKAVQAVIRHPDAPLNLVDLNLKNTAVTDAGLEGIENLPVLANVDLSGTRTSGSAVMRMKGLPALKTLRVGSLSMQFAAPPFIDPRDFPELRELSFNGVPVKGDAGSLIRQLRRLTRLELVKCSATDADLACVKPLVDLESLNISHNNVTDEGLVFLLGHPKLNSLDLSFTSIRGRGMTALVKEGELKELTSLSVGHVTLSDEFAEALIRLSKLQALDLSQTTCTDKGMTLLRAFKDLRVLNLAECGGIQGPGLQILGELPQLERLHLDLNPQFEDQHLALLTNLKGLRHLSLTSTGTSDLGVAKLREFLPECTIVRGGEEP